MKKEKSHRTRAGTRPIGKSFRQRNALFGAGAAVLLVLFLTLFHYCYPAISALGWQIAPLPEGTLRIHFVDVGQGDCTMIELPDGKIAVIDGGDSDQKEEVYAYARRLNVDRIDYLVVTHGDSDHLAGLTTLLQNVTIGTAYLPYEGAAVGNAYAAVKEQIESKAESVCESRRYMEISDEETGYKMVFLYPYRAELMDENADSNDTSAVIWLDYGGADAIFCGDISSSVEKKLTNEWNLDAETVFAGVALDSTEILKVAHHGSRYSSDAAWLNLLNFETAVVSCGKDNSYGHPHADTIGRLFEANENADIYRTDECGSVVASLHADGTYEMSYENGETGAADEGQKEMVTWTETWYVTQKKRNTERTTA